MSTIGPLAVLIGVGLTYLVFGTDFFDYLSQKWKFTFQFPSVIPNPFDPNDPSGKVLPGPGAPSNPQWIDPSKHPPGAEREPDGNVRWPDGTKHKPDGTLIP